MQILHIGHSPILKDARVLKYTKTLINAGHEVSLLGIDDGRYQYKRTDKPNLGEASFKLLDIANLRAIVISRVRAGASYLFYLLLPIALFYTSSISFEEEWSLILSFFLKICSMGLLISTLVGFDKIFFKQVIFFNLRKILKLINSITIFFIALLGLLYLIDFELNLVNSIKEGIHPFWLTLIVFQTIDLIIFNSKLSRYLFLFIRRLLIKLESILFKLIFKFLRKFINLYIFNKLFIEEFRGSNNYQEFDIIHIHDHIALLPALLFFKKNLSNTRVFWDAHELYIDRETTGVFISSYVRFILKFYGKYIHHVFTINETFKLLYGRLFKDVDISVVMNATHRNTCNPETNFSKIQNKINIFDKKIILFQGGLSEGRGIQILLEASENISDEYIIVFMGNGELENIIVDHHLYSSKIYHIPPVPHSELLEWTASAYLGIIPYENISKNHLFCTPNKLWEFPSAGIPFIATSLVEIDIFLDKYDIGYRLPRKFNAEDLTGVIQNINETNYSLKKQECLKCREIEHWEKYESVITNTYKKFLKSS